MVRQRYLVLSLTTALVVLTLPGCACLWATPLSVVLLALVAITLGLGCGARSISIGDNTDADIHDGPDGDSEGDAHVEACGSGSCPPYMTCVRLPELGDWCLPDADEDGIQDDADNCPWASNRDQSNSDEDDYGNVCDLIDGSEHPVVDCGVSGFDHDGDGIESTSCLESYLWSSPGFDSDNCTWLANPTQSDRDGDGLGDLCDLYPDVPGAVSPCGCPEHDSDGDGLSDLDQMGSCCDIELVLDSCPFTPSADSGDTDDDGVADVCDPDGIPPIAALGTLDPQRRSLLERFHQKGVLDEATVKIVLSTHTSQHLV